MRIIRFKRSKIACFNSFDIDIFVVQFVNKFQDIIAYSIHRHTESISIIASMNKLLLSYVLIQNIRNLSATIEFAGCNAHIDPITKRRTELCN